ncbi:hypothetical protein M0R04_06840 [Candidatus Dojkabacteria bacterium]|jgi:hypothetical protein|nr:hypothetical protein [Candidatus Dojkabacteria bacterium]
MWISKKEKDELEGTITALNKQSIGYKNESNVLAKNVETLKKELETANAEIDALKEKAKEEDHQTSTEPWFELVGQSIDPIKGLQFRSDWNPAMIQYLKENGIVDKDEDLVIQKFIAFLYQDLIEKFEQRVIDNSDKKTVSDFL